MSQNGTFCTMLNFVLLFPYGSFLYHAEILIKLSIFCCHITNEINLVQNCSNEGGIVNHHMSQKLSRSSSGLLKNSVHDVPSLLSSLLDWPDVR